MLIDEVREHRDKARKNKDEFVLMVLQLLYSDALKIGKDKRNDVPLDEDVITAAKKLIKGCKDTIALMEENGREPAYIQFEEEIGIYEYFLPKQLSKAEVIEEIKKFPDATVGIIMKHFKENFANQYNGKDVTLWIKQLRDVNEI